MRTIKQIDLDPSLSLVLVLYDNFLSHAWAHIVRPPGITVTAKLTNDQVFEVLKAVK